VDDTFAVDALKPCEGLDGKDDGIFEGDLAVLFQSILDVVAFDVLHDQVEAGFVFDGVFPLDDIGVFHACKDTGFAEEAFAYDFVIDEAGVEHFDGDGLFGKHVDAVENGAHPSGTQFFDDFVLSANDAFVLVVACGR
jgi:hypothetical protein